MAVTVKMIISITPADAIAVTCAGKDNMSSAQHRVRAVKTRPRWTGRDGRCCRRQAKQTPARSFQTGHGSS